MDKLIADANKQVLVQVVRMVQKQGLRGSKGGWKEFLNSHDKQFGEGLSDPAKRSLEILVAFLQTFTREEDLKFFGKMIRRHKEHIAMSQYLKYNPDGESPQQRLVRLTIEHPQFMQNYSFPSHGEEWVIVPLGKTSMAMKSTYMISIDCEMVLCEDGTEAVVKVCVVDQNLEVKLDKLVKPNKAIVDYRQEITGISAEDLEGDTCSLADILKSLKTLLKHGTILIGHSLYNDLRVLKIDHPRVIDTAYIFKFMNLPIGFSPSLNNLCKSVLGFEVRKDGEPHNCLHDAQAAMKLVLAKLEHGFDDPITIAAKTMPERDLAKLLLHRIPIDVPYQELLNLFPGEHNIDIQTDLRIKGQSYSTYAVFKDLERANRAFEEIQGQELKDNIGRPQKLTILKTSKGRTITVCICKMIDDCAQMGRDLMKKRSAQDDVNEPSRQKLCLQQCDHVKEIDRLKLELREREDEIFRLQKTVAALTEEHGI
ncbi:RNA exonuclease 1 protein [Dioscorea alata]|uniref:RNA exonuclease 1 protein n=1 Tax=Dioscorea alata TaxID=55571 RepID=A0ACB7VJW5_DIOAL|nr:RNA exonuclease 1 protein [Dioscorea alata]